MPKKDNYVTAGELASLYGIPKQTLLYYDKNKLLIPAFINEKGYRFYSESQYHTLEIILNMRKLDISVQNIKEYLQCRNIDNFENLLKNKEKECEHIIENMQNMKESLRLSLSSIRKIRKINIGQIELATQNEKLLLVSEILTDEISPRERMGIFSHHNQASFSKNHFKEFSTGWIIAREEFFAKKFNKTLRYFTPVTHTGSKKSYFLRPEGLYLTICFQGTFYQEILNIFDKIQNFIIVNNLRVIGNIYIFPLKNHWLTEDTKEYINEVSFQVEYME